MLQNNIKYAEEITNESVMAQYSGEQSSCGGKKKKKKKDEEDKEDEKDK